MTLRELLAAHPALFYPQTWFSDEPFMDVPVPRLSKHAEPPTCIVPFTARTRGADLPRAATLAQYYVRQPTLTIWRSYVWCCDLDRQRQRVYIGTNGKGLEVHRHIHLTERFGVASWEKAA